MNLFLNHFRDDLERLNGDLHKICSIPFAEASGLIRRREDADCSFQFYDGHF